MLYNRENEIKQLREWSIKYDINKRKTLYINNTEINDSYI